MATQPRELLPAQTTVDRAEQRRIFDPCVHGVDVRHGRLEVPNSGELPRVGGPVVPLMSAGRSLVLELVADGGPGLAAVIGSLDQLAEPLGGLRRVHAIGINGRTLDVIQLPPSEERTLDAPISTASI